MSGSDNYIMARKNGRRVVIALVELDEDGDVTLDEMDANREFILRACNNHERLMAALSVIVLDEHIAGWLSENDPKALEQARTALKELNT